MHPTPVYAVGELLFFVAVVVLFFFGDRCLLE